MGDDEYGPATAARAKWDFVPEEPSGLALTADDELEVWPTDKGWWFARKRRGGYEGYVPRDYVRVEGRHAEAAFPGLSARVATISPRRAEPPRNDDEDELQRVLKQFNLNVHPSDLRKILALYDLDGRVVSSISAATEADGKLFLGNLAGDYVSVLKL